MILNTLKFGEIEIEESRIFNFVLPVIGFDELTKYIILDPKKDTLFKWLQSVEDPSLAFPIISVISLNMDYSIDVADNVVSALEITNPESLLVMNITSIPQRHDNQFTCSVNIQY